MIADYTDLQSEIVTLTSENLDLKEENKQLSQQLEIKKNMHFKEPFWYAEGDEVPHCPNCWESEKKAIHLTKTFMTSYGLRHECPACKRFYIWPRKEKQISEGPTVVD